jgi:transposase
MLGCVNSLFDILKTAFSSFIDLFNEDILNKDGSEEAASQFATYALPQVSEFFLNNPTDYLLFHDIYFVSDRYIVEWKSTSNHSVCPHCKETSHKQHSVLSKPVMLQDLSLCGKPTFHKIWRKKYYCTNNQCKQKFFLESLDGFMDDRYSRMTVSLANHVINAATHASNRATVKILKGEGIRICKDTITRLVLKRGTRGMADNMTKNASSVTKLGIDDINLRKGDPSTSCMVVLNNETGEVLCIAQGTTAETAQNILSLFPNLEIVSRDRATAMASAVKQLGVTPVADRFHLVANMHDAIKKTIHSHFPKQVYIPTGNGWICLANNDDQDDIVISNIPKTLADNDIEQRISMAHLTAKASKNYRDTLRILELTNLGKHADEISKIMNLEPCKVRKLRSGMRETISNVEKRIDKFIADPNSLSSKQKSVPVNGRHSSTSIVEPYHDIVVSMRNEGKSHWVIFDKLKCLGFTGSHSSVDNYIIKLTRESSIENKMKDEYNKSKDPSTLIPMRPERISISIISKQSIYERVLAKIKESRPEKTKTDQPLDDSIPGGVVSEKSNLKAKPKAKTSCIPSTNRSNMPLEIANILNWIAKPSVNVKSKTEDIKKCIDLHLDMNYPLFSHLIQFGIDFHNFMDRNDPSGLNPFIDKYINDPCEKLAQFANGLQMDEEAVKNTLLYPKISNGIVEGTNNLIKLVKRQGCGKMKIDLLAAKVAILTAA